MRNLLRILLQYHFGILFIILEVISLSIYIGNNEEHKNKVLNSSHTVIGGFYNLSSSVFQYFNLRKINFQLINENAKLNNLLKASYKDNTVDLLQLYDSIYGLKYVYQPAKVINNSINKQYNYLTLNKGRNQGVKPEMAVVSPTGIVGVITEVSDNYSVAISVLNTKLNISAKIKRNGYFGSLTWNGNNYKHMILKDIPDHVEKNIGDTIVTSGYSAIFPENQLIGVITGYIDDANGNFIEIEVLLATDLKNLNLVYIISNLDRIEQKELEERAGND
jgi:rod shape-determining protein MreC